MFYEWLCMLCAPMHVERITMDNLPRVIALFASNPAIFRVCSRILSMHTSAKRISQCCHRGKRFRTRHMCWCQTTREDLAVIDFVEQYPDEKTGYLGFLIVSGGRHGCGMGSVLLSKIEQAASECGLSRMELGCYETNESGMAFWRASGFSPIRTSKQETDGILYTIVSMEKKI